MINDTHTLSGFHMQARKDGIVVYKVLCGFSFLWYKLCGYVQDKILNSQFLNYGVICILLSCFVYFSKMTNSEYPLRKVVSLVLQLEQELSLILVMTVSLSYWSPGMAKHQLPEEKHKLSREPSPGMCTANMLCSAGWDHVGGLRSISSPS